MANFLGWPVKDCPDCFGNWRESSKVPARLLGPGNMNILFDHMSALEGVWPPKRSDDVLPEQQCGLLSKWTTQALEMLRQDKREMMTEAKATRPRPGCFYDEVTKMRVCPFASVLINISHDVNNWHYIIRITSLFRSCKSANEYFRSQYIYDQIKLPHANTYYVRMLLMWLHRHGVIGTHSPHWHWPLCSS